MGYFWELGIGWDGFVVRYMRSIWGQFDGNSDGFAARRVFLYNLLFLSFGYGSRGCDVWGRIG